jgi:hypothetical protein
MPPVLVCAVGTTRDIRWSRARPQKCYVDLDFRECGPSAIVFVTSRAHWMKRSTTGLRVRFFRVARRPAAGVGGHGFLPRAITCQSLLSSKAANGKNAS